MSVPVAAVIEVEEGARKRIQLLVFAGKSLRVQCKCRFKVYIAINNLQVRV